MYATPKNGVRYEFNEVRAINSQMLRLKKCHQKTWILVCLLYQFPETEKEGFLFIHIYKIVILASLLFFLRSRLHTAKRLLAPTPQQTPTDRSFVVVILIMRYAILL